MNKIIIIIILTNSGPFRLLFTIPFKFLFLQNIQQLISNPKNKKKSNRKAKQISEAPGCTKLRRRMYESCLIFLAKCLSSSSCIHHSRQSRYVCLECHLINFYNLNAYDLM